jgi:hypothetical protein
MTTTKTLNLGCTVARHAQIGVDAIVNARAGLQALNDLSQEDIELMRDAGKIRDRIESRVRFYQFNSRFCRRHQSRLQHLISQVND